MQFIADEVIQNIKNLTVLSVLMRTANCIISNPTLQVEPYLHQLMPCILTCLVGKRLCGTPTEDHWTLRNFAAYLISTICKRYGNNYSTLQPRITKTLVRALLDPGKPLTTHYGAIVGISW